MSLLRSTTGLMAALLCATPLAAAASSLVPFGSGVRVLGEAQPSATVRFQVALRLRDAAGLAAVNASGRVLTPAQLEAYLPDASAHRAVLAWLSAQGLTIEATPASRLSIRVSGSAEAVSRALGVHFSSIVSEGRNHVSADREPVLPAALAGHILSINGLQPQLHATPMNVLRPVSAISPNAAGGVTPLYPSDLLTAYKANGLGNGAGTTTAIVIDTFPLTADLVTFWNTVGVAQSLSNITLIQTVPGTLPAPGGEESLDVEYSSSMAPASKVRTYASTDLSFANIDTSYLAVIADLQAGVKITQVSISLGACETGVSSGQKTTDDQYFATMTALGATVVVSSGDYGAKECSFGLNFGAKTPSFFSTSPNVAAIGGTTLTLKADSTIAKETAWNGSGGGISKFFAKPAWQAGISAAMRAVPDVAADANPNTGVLVIAGGKPYQVGGTSVSAPVWAGLLGLVNASRITAGKPLLGLLGPRTTPLVNTANFRDITTGNNKGYNAGPGFDLVTGVGSPVMSTLLPTLVGQN